MYRSLVRAALSAAIFIAASAFAASAQSANPAPAPTPSEIVHVTTADRQDEPISNTTLPTYVVDRSAIEAMGARTVAQALRDVPGVTIFSYGPYGSLVNYGILGATSEQTLVLLNGFPIAGGSSGSIDLGSLPTAGVDRIEIVEGGGSTLYGSSAVGGVINIITGRAPNGPYAELSDGTLGDRDARIEIGAQGLGLALERHLATNAYGYPSLDGFPAGTRTNAQAAATSARLDYRSGSSAAWTLNAGLGNNAVTIGVPGGILFLTPEAQQATAQSDAHATLTHRGARSAVSLSFAGARQALSFNDPQNGGETDTYDARAQVSLRDVVGTERSSLVSGIDLSRESALLYLGPSSVPPSASAALSQSAAYAQYRNSIPGLGLFSIGLRGEHDAPGGSSLVPSLGTLVDLGHARLAANYAGTFRVPTIDELYFPGFENPSLVPERSKNLDVTLRLPLGGSSVALAWFDRQADNLIAFNQNFVAVNVAQASFGGFVLSARTAPMNGIVATLGLTDLYRALNLTPGQPASRLEFDPITTATLGLARGFGGSRLAFGIDAQVRSPHVEAGTVRDGATTVDAYVRGKIAPYAIATVRAYNLGNERYAPILGYPAVGRALIFELSTR